MHEVIGSVDADQCVIQRCGGQDIALADLRGFFDERPQLVRATSETAQDYRLFFQQRNHPTADVTGCSRKQYDGSLRTFIIVRLQWRHYIRLNSRLGGDLLCGYY